MSSSPDVSLVSSVFEDDSDGSGVDFRFDFLFFFDFFFLDLLDLSDRERFERSSSSEGSSSPSGIGAEVAAVWAADATF